MLKELSIEGNVSTPHSKIDIYTNEVSIGRFIGEVEQQTDVETEDGNKAQEE